MKHCRGRSARKRCCAQQAKVPGLEFGVSAVAAILQLPSSSSNEHPIPYKLSLFSLLFFFYASMATPTLSHSYVWVARFSAGVAALSASLVVASLLCIAMESEFGCLAYLSCVVPVFSGFYRSLQRGSRPLNPSLQRRGSLNV